MTKLRIPLVCHECLHQSSGNAMDWMAFELRNDNTYRQECTKGHTMVGYLQNTKFEILIDLALEATGDRYYREAVADLSSALERFYEWCIDVILEARKFDYEQRQCVWNKVAGQSERQLGGFIYLWVMQFGNEPDTLSSTDAGFRNNVIHKGHFPSREETMKYGQRILDIIFPKMIDIKRQFWNAILKVEFEQIGRIVKEIKADRRTNRRITAVGIGTSVNIKTVYEDGYRPVFIDLVDRVKARGEIFPLFPSNSTAGCIEFGESGDGPQSAPDRE